MSVFKRLPSKVAQLLAVITGVYYTFFPFTTGTIACDHYARECEFGILKKKKQKQKQNKQKQNKNKNKNLTVVF